MRSWSFGHKNAPQLQDSQMEMNLGEMDGNSFLGTRGSKSNTTEVFERDKARVLRAWDDEEAVSVQPALSGFLQWKEGRSSVSMEGTHRARDRFACFSLRIEKQHFLRRARDKGAGRSNGRRWNTIRSGGQDTGQALAREWKRRLKYDGCEPSDILW